MDASAATNHHQQHEHEEKAVEVENILVAKLEESIKRRSIPWSSSFSKCKELLKDKLKAESHPDRKFRARFRRKVHHLNNLMAEHDSIINYGNALHVYRLNQIKKEIVSVLKVEGDKAADRLIKDHTQRVPSRPSPIAVHGLEVDQMAAENLLLCRDSSPEFNAFGIYGAEGVGKTALALAIFHTDKVKSRFFPRIWICLTDRQESEIVDEIFVAKRILLHLGIDLETIKEMDPPGIEGLKRAIKTELKGKRYLVVIDGVSEEMELGRVMKMLREALPKGVGGAVVVTGRAKKMVKEMVGGDEEGIYQLQPLEEQVKCWEVFKAATEEGEESKMDKDEKLKVKNEVVKRSHGLPWSSTLMGIIRREILKRGPQSTTAATTTTTTATPPPPPPPQGRWWWWCCKELKRKRNELCASKQALVDDVQNGAD